MGDKIYHKWTINLPNKIIEKINFKEGDILNATARQGKLILSVEGKKKSSRNDSIESKAFGISRLEKGIKIFNMSMDKLEKKYGTEVPADELEKELSKKLTQEEIDHAVGTLFVGGDCFFSKKDHIKRI